MWTLASFHVDGSQRRGSSGRNAGLSTASLTERRVPSSF
jgi:hypothetical protein